MTNFLAKKAVFGMVQGNDGRARLFRYMLDERTTDDVYMAVTDIMRSYADRLLPLDALGPLVRQVGEHLALTAATNSEVPREGPLRELCELLDELVARTSELKGPLRYLRALAYSRLDVLEGGPTSSGGAAVRVPQLILGPAVTAQTLEKRESRKDSAKTSARRKSGSPSMLERVPECVACFVDSGVDCSSGSSTEPCAALLPAYVAGGKASALMDDVSGSVKGVPRPLTVVQEGGDVCVVFEPTRHAAAVSAAARAEALVYGSSVGDGDAVEGNSGGGGLPGLTDMQPLALSDAEADIVLRAACDTDADGEARWQTVGVLTRMSLDMFVQDGSAAAQKALRQLLLKIVASQPAVAFALALNVGAYAALLEPGSAERPDMAARLYDIHEAVFAAVVECIDVLLRAAPSDRQALHFALNCALFFVYSGNNVLADRAALLDPRLLITALDRVSFTAAAADRVIRVLAWVLLLRPALDPPELDSLRAMGLTAPSRACRRAAVVLAARFQPDPVDVARLIDSGLPENLSRVVACGERNLYGALEAEIRGPYDAMFNPPRDPAGLAATKPPRDPAGLAAAVKRCAPLAELLPYVKALADDLEPHLLAVVHSELAGRDGDTRAAIDAGFMGSRGVLSVDDAHEALEDATLHWRDGLEAEAAWLFALAAQRVLERAAFKARRGLPSDLAEELVARLVGAVVVAQRTLEPLDGRSVETLWEAVLELMLVPSAATTGRAAHRRHGASTASRALLDGHAGVPIRVLRATDLDVLRFFAVEAMHTLRDLDVAAAALVLLAARCEDDPTSLSAAGGPSLFRAAAAGSGAAPSYYASVYLLRYLGRSSPTDYARAYTAMVQHASHDQDVRLLTSIPAQLEELSKQ